MKIIVAIVVLLTCAVGLAAGFLPTAARLTLANFILRYDGETITHPDMTRQAILRTVAKIFIDNPNPRHPGGSNVVQELLSSKLDVSELIDAYYGNEGKRSRKSRKDKLDRYISKVETYNGNVDINELRMAKAHFDSEQFDAAQKRLIDFRNMASNIIRRNAGREQYDNARKFTGRLLHTLQDFYSHTNWIENWVGEADTTSPYRVLGEANREVENVAREITNPCTDCSQVSIWRSLEAAKLRVLAIDVFHVESSSLYVCEGNIDSSLRAQKRLTSGYSLGGMDTDKNVIVKPDGKCSHGGIIDGSQDRPARGGINKDSTHRALASHYNYHRQAAEVAQQHSHEFLASMRSDVKNDRLFSEFLGIEVDQLTTSVAAVVDTTLKTSQGLNEIRAASVGASRNMRQYMPDTEVQYILVPVNDTDVRRPIITDDVNQFSESISQLSIQSTGDGSVPVIDAIRCAAEVSEPDSLILVFTDSSASDPQLLGTAEAMVSEKNLKVVFIQDTASSMKRSLQVRQMQNNKMRSRRQDTDENDIYEELEMFSDGQIIEVSTSEISELAPFIAFSALSSNTIFREEINEPGRVEYSFPVDSYTEQILIFVCGQNINVSILTPQGVNADGMPQYFSSVNSSTLYTATINTTEDSLYGQWGIIIESGGPFAIQVLAYSELIISTQIFTVGPDGEDIGDPKPLEGYSMFAQLTIIGSENSVVIDSINVVNDQGFVLSLSNLTAVENNSYIGLFDLPPEEFQLQVNGTDDKGFPFSYISDVSVDPTEISLAFGENEVGYEMLQPGEEGTVSITLMNAGRDDRFRINIDTDASDDQVDFFNYIVTPGVVSVRRNTTADVMVEISLHQDAPIGFSVTFTLVAQSLTDVDVNDYIIFDVTNTLTEQTNPMDSSADLLLSNKKVMMILLSMLLFIYSYI